MRFGWLAAAAACVMAAPASAAVVSYDFEALFPLAGTYSGSFSYDDEAVDLLSIDFNLAGKQFDLTNTEVIRNALTGPAFVIGGIPAIYVQPNLGGSVEDNDFFIVIYDDMSQFRTNAFAITTSAYGFETARRVILNGVLYGAVPESSTWALMIGGFGAIGASTRRRRRFHSAAA